MSEISKPMAHEEAEEMQAVDRYLLHELTEEQQIRFEEHYFECTSCAEAVMAGQEFVHALSEHGRSSADLPWWQRMMVLLKTPISVPSWGVLLSGAAGACFVFLAGTQQFASRPQANTVILASEVTKGAEDDKSYALKTPSATVEVILPSKASYQYYLVTITSDQQQVVSHIVPAPTNQPGGRLSVQVASKMLAPGHFAVSLRGLTSQSDTDGPTLETYGFDIRQ
jgi:hypothetical protein